MLDFETEVESTSKRETISSADIFRCVGKEPSFNNIGLDDPNYDQKYAQGLNWANYALDVEELKLHTIEFVKSPEQKEILKLVKASRFMHVGKICYLANSGCPLKESSKQRIEQSVESLIKQADLECVPQVEVTKVNKADIKATKLDRKVSDLIAVIDEIADNLIINEKEPKTYDMLVQQNAESHIVKEVLAHYRKKYNVFLEENKALLSDLTLEQDEKEAYTKDIQKQMIAIDHIWPDLSCYLGNNKAKRNTKASKSKKQQTQVERVVKTVKFKTHDATLKIQSVPLDRVLGSQMLLVFNSKNRKLAMYYAKDDTGLQIKGTTLLNFDETKSVQKTLRKPEQFLSHLQQSSDYRASIVFRDLSTHPDETNGRLNEHTILLKAFKTLTKI